MSCNAVGSNTAVTPVISYSREAVTVLVPGNAGFLS
jgi:hypothetical protein